MGEKSGFLLANKHPLREFNNTHFNNLIAQLDESLFFLSQFKEKEILCDCLFALLYMWELAQSDRPELLGQIVPSLHLF